MCGICGYVASDGVGAETIIREMTATLAHRGPDGSDVHIESEPGVALGHSRLSVLELSSLGQQPMQSACGRYVITYNGEVYNHLLLRPELEGCGHIFRGNSDTETILAAISHWGLRGALDRFIGMFAFALWDRRERKLFLVRDRLGIKPLYYGWCGNDFLFSSELKAIRAYPGCSLAVDRDALTLLFRHNYVPSPHCIYKGFHKLLPGTVLTLEPSTGRIGHELFWDVRDVWIRGSENPSYGCEDEALEALEALVRDAIELRMLSDVPVGAFLSGGIDSSAVCAIMQAVSDRPVKTFSLGFDEKRYDETPYARKVAEHLGTEHVEGILHEKDLIADIPNFPSYWDEPFSDTGQLTAHLVSKAAREQVTVCLSGDGGDELFLGYQRYFEADAWCSIDRIPAPVRSLCGGLGRTLNKRMPSSHPGLHRSLARLSLLGARNFSDCYRYQVSHNKYPETLVLGAREPETCYFRAPEGMDDPRLLMPLWDLEGYIHDGILTKVDRASMAEALEVRVPLLDHRVVEFAASIPLSMKIGPDGGKHLLRRLLYKYVPREMIHRPKMGFGVPLDSWLKDGLREWAEDLLDENMIRKQGFLDPARVRSIWKAFLGGLPGGAYLVWDMLMFQSWLQNVS